MFSRRTNQDFNIRLVDVKNEKYNGLLAGVSIPSSSRAPGVSLAPKTSQTSATQASEEALIRGVLDIVTKYLAA